MPTQVSVSMGAILREPSAKAMPCGVFGSFGWSGEAVDEMEGRLRDAGFGFAFDAIRVKFKPTAKVGQGQVLVEWGVLAYAMCRDAVVLDGFECTVRSPPLTPSPPFGPRPAPQDLLLCEESGRALAQSIKKKIKTRELAVAPGRCCVADMATVQGDREQGGMLWVWDLAAAPGRRC